MSLAVKERAMLIEMNQPHTFRRRRGRLKTNDQDLATKGVMVRGKIKGDRTMVLFPCCCDMGAAGADGVLNGDGVIGWIFRKRGLVCGFYLNQRRSIGVLLCEQPAVMRCGDSIDGGITGGNR